MVAIGVVTDVVATSLGEVLNGVAVDSSTDEDDDVD